jgi:ABC-2 type transport system ATP-binding protein
MCVLAQGTKLCAGGFLGPNGAGKSTTLRLRLGLAQPTSGEAPVFGPRYAELDDPARRVSPYLSRAISIPTGLVETTFAPLGLANGVSRSRVDQRRT